MYSRLTPLIKLFYDPLRAMADLGGRAPYFFGLGIATLATFIYHSFLIGDLPVLFSALFNQGTGARSSAVVGYLVTRIFGSLMPLLFLAVVFVPACLLAAS